MAVTYMTGFEGQQTAINGVTPTNTASISTVQVRTGAVSLRCNPASSALGYGNRIVTMTGFHHFGLFVASLPTVDRHVFGDTSANSINLRLTSAGNVAVYVDTTLLGTSSTALSTGQWYWIGVRNTAGTSVAYLQINGTTEVTATAAGAAAPVQTRYGCYVAAASAIDIYIDDVVVDDTAFLASSKVDIALPISDNTRTAVTGGAGGTTNLWDAVNNTPPTGVASASETDTTNIEYPASLTEDYIANLETYTTLGVGASDTVLAVQSIVQHGEDIATGTKNLQNIGALTNPTVAGVSATAGADAGAHGATPTLWTTVFGTLTASPSVTLGTSPTIRTSRISESRVACIDFMGMLVAWTPAAVATRVPYVNRMPQLLAH